MSSFLKNFFASALGSIFGFVFVLIGVFVVLPIALTLVFSGGRHSSVEAIKSNSILHLNVRGQVTEKHRPIDFEIFGDRSIFSEDKTIGLYDWIKAIDLAKTDKRIAGIFIELREFDSGWAAMTSLRRHLEDFAKSGKWVYAYADRMNEMGYYLASAANGIYMEPWGELEFNGLGVNEMFFKGALDKLELEPRIFRVGRFKAAVEPLTRTDMSAENREQTQSLITDLWLPVRAAAAAVAKVEPARIDEIVAKLEVVSADTAKKAGLVHETIFLDELEERLKKFTVGEDEELELVTPGRFLKNAKSPRSGPKKIAVIFAEGEIRSGQGGRDQIGSEGLREEIVDAKTDEDVAAIVLRINSPGGDALASDVIWREVRIADDELPVVISMGDVAASGGYYIAAAGRYVFAEPTTITGSIGVFGILFSAEKFFKNKTGVSFDRAVTHPFADIGSFSRPMLPFEGQSIQKEVERVYTRFLDVVQEGRGYEKRADLESIAEGRVWSGTRAKELGLVDELGGLDQAIAKAAEFAEITDYQIEIFPSETDPFRHLMERLGGESLANFLGLRSDEVRSLANTVRQVKNGPLNLKNGTYARLLYDLKIR